MQKIPVFIICFCIYMHAAAQSNIVKVEYYIDSDPGPGNATNIPVTAAVNIADKTFPVTLTGLSQGIHAVFVRSKNANGKWSVTNPLYFYRPSTINTAGNVVKAEYYIDNDPGFGLATNIPLTAGTNVQNIPFTANISASSPGIHVLSVRSKDANGRWSITNQLVYFKNRPAAASANITKAEYYFDSDPGFGSGTNIPVTAAADIQNISFSAGIGTLSQGLHVLNVRSYQAGKWSVTNQLLFYKPQTAGGSVSEVEYFYDSDPGFGNAIPVAINATNNLANYLVPVNITGLATGSHNLFIRSKASNGWSVTNMFDFTINSTSPAPYININSITSNTNCAYTSFRISFHATGNFLPANKFTVQLSGPDGSFATPINIGQVTSQVSSIVTCNLPSHLADGTAYRVRVISSSEAVTGVSSLTPLTIHDRPNLGNDTTVFIVCADETLDLTPVYNTAGLTVNWSTPTPTEATPGNYRLIVTNVHGCRDTANATVKQDISTWTGSINTNWHNAANWSTGRVPTEKTHVIVSGTTANNCEISTADGSAASVQLRQGGFIKVLNNRMLFVTANCNPLPTGL